MDEIALKLLQVASSCTPTDLIAVIARSRRRLLCPEALGARVFGHGLPAKYAASAFASSLDKAHRAIGVI